MENSKIVAKNLVGRPYWQAPIVAARVDHRSSVAHNLAAAKAIESACGIKVSVQTRQLRELTLAAEIIKNHTNNLYFDVLLGFLGLDSAEELPKLHPELFADALALQKFTNRIIISIAGRAIHPITSVVGGFKSYPNFQFGDASLWGETSPNVDAAKTLRLFSSFDLPASKFASNFAALHLDKDYAFYDGEIWTSQGDLFTEDKFLEFTKKWGHFSPKRSVPMTTGPLARYNLSQSHFDESIKKLLAELKVEKSLPDSAQSVLASAVELYYFVTQTTKILGDFVKDGVTKEHILPPRKFSSGVAAVESADGTVIHSCELDENGIILKYGIDALGYSQASSRPVARELIRV